MSLNLEQSLEKYQTMKNLACGPNKSDFISFLVESNKFKSDLEQAITSKKPLPNQMPNLAKLGYLFPDSSATGTSYGDCWITMFGITNNDKRLNQYNSIYQKQTKGLVIISIANEATNKIKYFGSELENQDILPLFNVKFLD